MFTNCVSRGFLLIFNDIINEKACFIKFRRETLIISIDIFQCHSRLAAGTSNLAAEIKQAITKIK